MRLTVFESKLWEIIPGSFEQYTFYYIILDSALPLGVFHSLLIKLEMSNTMPALLISSFR